MVYSPVSPISKVHPYRGLYLDDVMAITKRSILRKSRRENVVSLRCSTGQFHTLLAPPGDPRTRLTQR